MILQLPFCNSILWEYYSIYYNMICLIKPLMTEYELAYFQNRIPGLPPSTFTCSSVFFFRASCFTVTTVVLVQQLQQNPITNDMKCKRIHYSGHSDQRTECKVGLWAFQLPTSGKVTCQYKPTDRIPEHI